MAKWIKEGKSENEIIEADAEVRRTVEAILSDVGKRGDDAVRELSKKFDNYDPENFILSSQQIEEAISKVSKRDIDDIQGWNNDRHDNSHIGNALISEEQSNDRECNKSVPTGCTLKQAGKCWLDT